LGSGIPTLPYDSMGKGRGVIYAMIPKQR
jgi:hypothetical protein